MLNEYKKDVLSAHQVSRLQDKIAKNQLYFGCFDVYVNSPSENSKNRMNINSIAKSTGYLLMGAAGDTIYQILSIPLYLKNWGESTYSDWILISILPSMLIRSGAGIFQSTGSSVINLYSIDKKSELAGLVDSGIEATKIFMAVGILLYLTSIFVIGFSSGFSSFDMKESLLIGFVYSVYMIVFQLMQYSQIFIKISEKPERAFKYQICYRWSFIVPMVIFPFIGFDPLSSLCVSVLIQSLLVLVWWKLSVPSSFSAKSYYSRTSNAYRRNLKVSNVLKLGVGFSLYGTYTSLQQFVLTLTAKLFLENDVVVFIHAVRTVSRLPIIAIKSLEGPVRIRFSNYANFHDSIVSRISKYYLSLVTIISVISSALIFVFSDVCLKIIGVNEGVQNGYEIILLFSLSSLFVTMTYSLFTYWWAHNAHLNVTIKMFVLGVVALPVVFVFGDAGSAVVVGVYCIADGILFLFLCFTTINKYREIGG